MNFFSKRSIIHPEDNTDLAYWTKRWGVSVRQINHAILETGSLNLLDIKNALKRKGEIMSVSFLINKIFKRILNRFRGEKFPLYY
ncbi:MAG: DUF3606 domain-containing protein [Bacteroidota bacterium]|nr:DUF3606 domain-containing protein [Bacteroidota bacterium]